MLQFEKYSGLQPEYGSAMVWTITKQETEVGSYHLGFINTRNEFVNDGCCSVYGLDVDELKEIVSFIESLKKE